MSPKDRYKWQRRMNRVSDFLWSTLMKLVVLTIAIVVFIFALPWLQKLWMTINGSEFQN